MRPSVNFHKPSIASTTLAPAIAERMVSDFGGKAGPTAEGVRALAAAIGGDPASAVRTSLEQWSELFRKTCGQDWPRPKARLDRLARQYGVPYDPAQPQIVLFALQSWYILVVKLLAGQIVAAARGRKSPLDGEHAGRIGHAGPLVEAIESGALFAALGVTDPWCGGPFGWMVSAWSPALERAVAWAAARIARYDPPAIIAHAAGGGDLLKPLYESLFPRAVRHALGEFYTPNWLAEHVLDQVGYRGQAGARLLDPTCGSGTFLLAAIRRWRQSVLITLRRDDKASRRSVMSTDPTAAIVGFDLHPLAVASARANYLLAVADLLGPEGTIEVPVFARDAILDPGAGRNRVRFRRRQSALDRLGQPAGRLSRGHEAALAALRPVFAFRQRGAAWRRQEGPLDARALRGRRSLSGPRGTARHGDHADALSDQGGGRRLPPLSHRRRRPAAAGRARGRPGRASAVRRGGQLDERGRAAKGRAHDLSGKVREVGPEQSGERGAGSGERRAGSRERGAGSGEERNGERPASSLILHPSSLILHPSSLILHPSSLILHPSSLIPSLENIFCCELLAQPIDPDCPTTPWIVHPQGSAVDPTRLVGRADYTARSRRQ